MGVSKSPCGVGGVLKIHNVLSILLAFPIDSNSGLTKGVCELNKTEGSAAVLGLVRILIGRTVLRVWSASVRLLVCLVFTSKNLRRDNKLCQGTMDRSHLNQIVGEIKHLKYTPPCQTSWLAY